jgi:ribonuclease HIII
MADAAGTESPDAPGSPRIGSDESGKGDYFGPLATAAVYLEQSTADRLATAGVRDSKRVHDRRIAPLAALIRDEVGTRSCCVIALAPPVYNALQARLRSQGRSTSWLLAWLHARCIENLLARGHRPEVAVVDRFARPELLSGRLLPLTRGLELPIVQRPRAESDMAVAAASILARAAFLDGLYAISAKAGVELPKGAGARVDRVAGALACERGRSGLRAVAKLHFRTTERALATIAAAPRCGSPAAGWARRTKWATQSPYKYLT